MKKKLVELLEAFLPPTDYGKCAGYARRKCDRECAQCVAKDLIVNGVTVQEWISVEDRLPEKSGYYLYYAAYPHVGVQNGVGVSYYQHKAREWKKVYTPCVTHWMPLPEPPGED